MLCRFLLLAFIFCSAQPDGSTASERLGWKQRAKLYESLWAASRSNSAAKALQLDREEVQESSAPSASSTRIKITKIRRVFGDDGDATNENDSIELDDRTMNVTQTRPNITDDNDEDERSVIASTRQGGGSEDVTREEYSSEDVTREDSNSPEVGKQETVDVVTSISLMETHIDTSISVESQPSDWTYETTPSVIAGPTVPLATNTNTGPTYSTETSRCKAQQCSTSDEDDATETTSTEQAPIPINTTTTSSTDISNTNSTIHTNSAATSNTNSTITTPTTNSTATNASLQESQTEGTLIFYLGEDTPEQLEQLVQDNVIQVIAQSIDGQLIGYQRPAIEVEGSNTDFSRTEGSGGSDLPAPRYISIHF